VRTVSRSLIALFIAVVSGTAALAHFAIDVVGDYALRHDTFDDVSHESREVLAALALILAATLIVRGLRHCCELGAAHRFRLAAPALAWRTALPFVGGAAIMACVAVPAMEYLDATIAGSSLADLSDAFGGSIALGLSVTLACSSLIAAVVFALARWLVAHRETITAALLVFSRRVFVAPNTYWIRRRLIAPNRRLTVHALRLCKRGPPNVDVLTINISLTINKEDPCGSSHFSRAASAARGRDGIGHRLAGGGPNSHRSGWKYCRNGSRRYDGRIAARRRGSRHRRDGIGSHRSRRAIYS